MAQGEFGTFLKTNKIAVATFLNYCFQSVTIVIEKYRFGNKLFGKLLFF